jgi:hypothetical protein
MFVIVNDPLAVVVAVRTTFTDTAAPLMGAFVAASTTVPVIVAYCCAGGTDGPPHAASSDNETAMAASRIVDMPRGSLGGYAALFCVLAVEVRDLLLDEPAVRRVAALAGRPLA